MSTPSSDFGERARTALSELQLNAHSLNQVWGANKHLFQSHSPITTQTVEEIEREHGMRLPLDYRTYLTEVGNGGAGPWQGMLPLQIAVLESERGCADCLHRDFAPAHLLVREVEATWLQFRDPRERGFISVPPEEALKPEFTAGSLIIAFGKPKGGEATTYRLVLNGPHVGRVWRDDRARSRSLGPCRSASRHLYEVSFRDWFEAWLEDARLAQQFSL